MAAYLLTPDNLIVLGVKWYRTQLTVSKRSTRVKAEIVNFESARAASWPTSHLHHMYRVHMHDTISFSSWVLALQSRLHLLWRYSSSLSAFSFPDIDMSIWICRNSEFEDWLYFITGKPRFYHLELETFPPPRSPIIITGTIRFFRRYMDIIKIVIYISIRTISTGVHTNGFLACVMGADFTGSPPNHSQIVQMYVTHRRSLLFWDRLYGAKISVKTLGVNRIHTVASLGHRTFLDHGMLASKLLDREISGSLDLSATGA